MLIINSLYWIIRKRIFLLTISLNALLAGFDIGLLLVKYNLYRYLDIITSLRNNFFLNKVCAFKKLSLHTLKYSRENFRSDSLSLLVISPFFILFKIDTLILLKILAI
jgi:hypothetical protein